MPDYWSGKSDRLTSLRAKIKIVKISELEKGFRIFKPFFFRSLFACDNFSSGVRGVRRRKCGVAFSAFLFRSPENMCGIVGNIPIFDYIC